METSGITTNAVGPLCWSCTINAIKAIKQRIDESQKKSFSLRNKAILHNLSMTNTQRKKRTKEEETEEAKK